MLLVSVVLENLRIFVSASGEFCNGGVPDAVTIVRPVEMPISPRRH